MPGDQIDYVFTSLFVVLVGLLAVIVGVSLLFCKRASNTGPPAPSATPGPLTSTPKGNQAISGRESDLQSSSALTVYEDQELGRGSFGTVVFAGDFLGRRVAVKRVLRQRYPHAAREFEVLNRTDSHACILRCFCVQHSADGLFTSLALELCAKSLLTEVTSIMHRRQNRLVDVCQRQPGEVSPLELRVEADGLAPLICREILFPPPSNSVRRFLRKIVTGVAHLHDHGIAHLDITPSNILLQEHDPVLEDAAAEAPLSPHDSDPFQLQPKWRPKISGLSFARHTPTDAAHSSSGSAAAEGGEGAAAVFDAPLQASPGPGWLAPEVLCSVPKGQKFLRSRGTASEWSMIRTMQSAPVDIWNLGCVIFYVITGGGHPFADNDLEIEKNILLDFPVMLSQLEHLPGAMDLVQSMLHRDPSARPKAKQLLEHPFFWSDRERMAFFQTFSDRLEKEPADSPIRGHLEASCERVLGSSLPVDWSTRLPPSFVRKLNVGAHRKYCFSNVLDCIRMLRNKTLHFAELSHSVRAEMGVSCPEDLLRYVLSPGKFPELLMAAYRTAVEYLADESEFQADLGWLTVEASAEPARLRKVAGVAALSTAVSGSRGKGGTGAGGGSIASRAFPQPCSPLDLSSSPVLSSSAVKLAAGGGVCEPLPASNSHRLPPVVASSDDCDPSPRPSPQVEVAPPLPPLDDGPAPTQSPLPASAPLRLAARAVTPHRSRLSVEEVLTQWRQMGAPAVGDIECRPWSEPSSTSWALEASRIAAAARLFQDSVLETPVEPRKSREQGRGLLIAACGSVRESKFKGGARVWDGRYKSVECVAWREKSVAGVPKCPRGLRCDFAHGPVELRVREEDASRAQAAAATIPARDDTQPNAERSQRTGLEDGSL